MKTLITILASTVLTINTNAQDGTLDTSFDFDGKCTTAIGSGNDYATSSVLQPDGKILVAGYSTSGTAYNFTLVRYNVNGSLDTSFDFDGKLVTPIGTLDSYGRHVSLQSDGKIVVVGDAFNGLNYDITLVRYNINGSLDNTFDSDGIATLVIPNSTANSLAYSSVIQNDGKIIIGGYTYTGTNNDFLIARFNANGSLDNTFDVDGIVTTSIGSGDDNIRSVTLQNDGKIVVTGISSNGLNYDLALARYNTNGSLDSTFDNDGLKSFSIGSGHDYSNSVVIQNDGKILVAGYSLLSNADFSLVRLNSNGSFDTAFDVDGVVTTDVSGASDYCKGIAVQPDGKILVVGSANGQFALVRYNTNGSLDSGFDTDGMVTTSIGLNGDANSILLQADGKIVVTGYSNSGVSGADFAVVRYNNSITTGLDEIILNQKIVTIYPNPTSDNLTIKINPNINIDELKILNIEGQEVKTVKTFLNKTINLQKENLSAGIYYINFMINNKIITTDKIVIAN